MPYRNRVPNAAELLSRSLNWTSADSLCERSAMVNALTPLFAPPAVNHRLMMNKSLLGRGRESSDNRIYGFQRMGHKIAALRTKKSRRFRRLLKLITGRRQTEWTGATRCPNEDADSHKRESLIVRKRANFLRDH